MPKKSCYFGTIKANINIDGFFKRGSNTCAGDIFHQSTFFSANFLIFDREYDSRGPRNTKDVPGGTVTKKALKNPLHSAFV